MRVYVPYHPTNAGHWVYNGFFKAWEEMGYDPVFYGAGNPLSSLVDSQDYIVMGVANSFNDGVNLSLLEKSRKTILFAPPTFYPDPWGSHPNWQTLITQEAMKELNALENCFLWTFTNKKGEKYYKGWKKVHSLPLALDSISYKPEEVPLNCDVCFVGSSANNGFNEKLPIMKKVFDFLENSPFKAELHINKNLTHKDENDLLNRSKVALNIHDSYQRELGLDCNERTFKALGVNGILVNDEVEEVKNIFPKTKCESSLSGIFKAIKEYCEMDNEKLRSIKKKNQEEILRSHTYIHRVTEMLSLK